MILTKDMVKQSAQYLEIIKKMHDVMDNELILLHGSISPMHLLTCISGFLMVMGESMAQHAAELFKPKKDANDIFPFVMHDIFKEAFKMHEVTLYARSITPEEIQ